MFFNEEDSAGPEASVTVSEVTSSPEEFYGERVTVSGEIENVLGPRAFSIGGQHFAGQRLLVVLAKDVPLPAVSGRSGDTAFAADDIVQVSGPARRFSIVQFEREAGVDLHDHTTAGTAG